ncbi:polymorphic toxin type 46 domain-containing protein [Chryseobacterium sp. LC2016-29]|uniref:polymorphic toxin type 46 domain-containing protein n=1 Tax=Chryseobacterium sp. LC2016-29 TaxID=2897331 RepID=UPI001E30E12D|nr:polymorphic toxin type 46 domain-containing protein [Chryseobacterium sp. LC2016-29]MCD0480750.1 polymorphic toxin type 46 domain-containing protein [Chryseobacterium sp. LC2016-29]
MKTAKPVEKDSKPHHHKNKKQRQKKTVVMPLSKVEIGGAQTQKSEKSSVKQINGNVSAVHGSQTIYDQGSEIRYKKFQESLVETGNINHPETKKLEKSYMSTLNVNQMQDYHSLKSGTYLPKTAQEQVVMSQKLKNQGSIVKTPGEKETLEKISSKSEESNLIIDQKPNESIIEIKTPTITPVLSEANRSNSNIATDKNASLPTEKVKIKDEKKSNEKKINTKATGEKETKVSIPDDIQPVVTPRMEKAVDSEQAEIAPDAQTTINIVGLIAAAQEFRDQGVEARSQVKTQNEAANTIKNKIKEVQKEIQKSDADLEKSEDSIQSKETLIRKLEKGLETSVKRQQKVEQEVGIYQQEYNKNKTKANDFNNEAKSLLGGSQKHQDPQNADSGTLTKKLNELNANAGTINQAVTQAGNTTQKLSQEAQQAKGKNAKIKSEILSSRASILKSKAKLASDSKKNKEAKTELEKLTPKLKQVESQSKKLNQEADGLIKDSYAIENEVVKTQNAYYANMAIVEGRNSLIQKEKDKIQNTPKELNQEERLLIDFAQLKTEDEQVVFLRKLSPNQQNLLRDKLEEVNANYDNDQLENQSLIDQNVESIRDSQIEVFNNKRKDALQKPLNLVTKNLNRITGLKRLWMSISIAFSGIWNDITGITWTDVGKFIESIFSPKAWFEAISGSISGIWDDLTNWKGFSQDPVGMILQKAAGIANKVLTIAGVITGILGILTIAAAAGAIFTLGGLAPLAAWLGGATITMGTITFWIGAIALGLNVLNGIKNIYDVHTAKTAEVLFKNSGELKSDIANSGMAILAMIGGKASKKGGASIKDLAKRNPKTFGKRMFITARNGIKASIVSIPRKITSVFKKETWIKASQRFKTAYKKAKEWVVEPFKKKDVTPISKVKNTLEETPKPSYNPKQHAEFIDTPENLPEGKLSKNTNLAKQKSIKNSEENLINSKNDVSDIINSKKENTIHELSNKHEIEILKSPETEFGKIKMAYEYYKQLGWDKSRIKSHLDGIDFTKPVELVELPINKLTSQYQAPGGKKGNYFAEPNAKATELGINPKAETPLGIVEKTKTMYKTDQKTIVLKSTARSGINDTWSVPSQKPYKTLGGGTQYFTIDNIVFILTK